MLNKSAWYQELEAAIENYGDEEEEEVELEILMD